MVGLANELETAIRAAGMVVWDFGYPGRRSATGSASADQAARSGGARTTRVGGRAGQDGLLDGRAEAHCKITACPPRALATGKQRSTMDGGSDDARRR